MKKLFIISSLILFMQGCVEHFITINIHSNGGYTIEYISEGDSIDVFDKEARSSTRWVIN